MKSEKRLKRTGPTRRDLIKSLATVPLLPSLDTPASTQQTEKTPSPEVPALTQVIHTRYGRYLSPEQLAEVQKDVESGLQTSARLRARKLKNSDEPDFVFRAS